MPPGRTVITMSPAGGVTVLVVDDEPALRRAVVRGLTRAGYACREAGSGLEAIRDIERHPPELMISDLRMPEMDGVTLLGEVHSRWPEIAIIMATAVAEVETAVACLQRGAMDYLTKPFQLEEVQVRVEQVLEKRRLILENRRYQERLAELVAQQAARIEELFLEAVQTLVDALEAKDAYTRGHSTRVSAYATAVAQTLDWPEPDLQLLGLGAELHDIGKIGVREVVLQKPGKLTEDEYAHLMQHTAIGATILAPLMKHAAPVVEIVRSHHERLDGTGFPDGLKGEAIPVHARLVSVCDAFDAMTSHRPYRRALPPEVAINELVAAQGAQFDPEIVAAFRATYPGLAGLPIATPPKVRRIIPGVVAGTGVSASTTPG